MNSLKEHLAGGAAHSRGAIDHSVAHGNIAIHNGTVTFPGTGIDIDNGKGVDIRQIRDPNGSFGIRGGKSAIVSENIAFRGLQDNLWVVVSM